MDTIILAGGYGERLYPLTKNKAKALLEIGKDGKPLLAYTLEALNQFYERKRGTCYLTVNKKFHQDFLDFSYPTKTKFNLELVVEDTTPETKPGTIGAITNIFNSCPEIRRNNEVMVIAGDSLSSLRLRDLYDAYLAGNYMSVIAAYRIDDPRKAGLYGCLKLEKRNRHSIRKVLGISEKPKHPRMPAFVNTTQFILDVRALVGLYAYSSKPRKGEFFNWLIRRNKFHVNALIFNSPGSYWFDIGDKDSLKEARRFVEANPSISSQNP